MVDANGANGQVWQAQLVQQFGANRIARFGANPLNAADSVVPLKVCQINATHGFAQPSSLIRLFDRATTGQGRRAPLNRGGVGLNACDPIQIQRHTGIARAKHLRQLIVHC